jgi:uncharacterized small protein (DUF1192 family)
MKKWPERSKEGQLPMVSDSVLANDVVAQRLLHAFAVISQRNDAMEVAASVISEQGIAALKAELERIAAHFIAQPDSVSDSATLVRRINAWMGGITAGNAPLPVSGAEGLAVAAKNIQLEALMAKVKKVEWKTHKDRTGKKTHWTAKWEGFNLRVEVKKLPPPEKTVFCGFIDDEQVAKASGPGGLTRAQSAVELDALQKLATRPKN